jgi:hypothetical protein
LFSNVISAGKAVIASVTVSAANTSASDAAVATVTYGVANVPVYSTSSYVNVTSVCPSIKSATVTSTASKPSNVTVNVVSLIALNQPKIYQIYPLHNLVISTLFPYNYFIYCTTIINLLLVSLIFTFLILIWLQFFSTVSNFRLVVKKITATLVTVIIMSY